MRVLSISTGAGLRSPGVEGKLMSREFVKTFLNEYEGHISWTTVGLINGVPNRPVALLELVNEPYSNFSRALTMGQERDEEQCPRELKRVAGIS